MKKKQKEKKKHEIEDYENLIQATEELKGDGKESKKNVLESLLDKVVIEIHDVDIKYLDIDEYGQEHVVGIKVNSLLIKKGKDGIVQKVCDLNKGFIYVMEGNGNGKYEELIKKSIIDIDSGRMFIDISIVNKCINVEANVPSITLDLTRKQLRSLMLIVNRLKEYAQTVKFISCRPLIDKKQTNRIKNNEKNCTFCSWCLDGTFCFCPEQ